MSVLYLLVSFTIWFSHGDLDDRIAELSMLIEQHPDQHELYQQRGDLYIQHDEFLKAIADFRHCLDHNIRNTRVYWNTRVYFGIAVAYHQEAFSDSALVYIEKVLDETPDHLMANEIKASSLAQKGEYCEAALLRETIFQNATSLSPDLVMTVADTWYHCTQSDALEKSVSALNKGLAAIGYNKVLQQKLVNVYVAKNDLQNAIRAQSEIVEHGSFKVRALYDRSQLFIQYGQKEAAQKDLITALDSWDAMPQHKKEIRSLIKLREDILITQNTLAD